MINKMIRKKYLLSDVITTGSLISRDLGRIVNEVVSDVIYSLIYSSESEFAHSHTSVTIKFITMQLGEILD